MNSKFNRVLVIGAGVIGATTAYELLEKGYDVTLLAKQFAQGDYSITSEIAGAQWGYPPGFCGYYSDDFDFENPKKWAMVSYNKFLALSMNSSQTGVYWRPWCVFYKQKMEEIPVELQRIKEMSSMSTFRHSASLIEETGISPTDLAPVVDSYTVQAPSIDTTVFMKWLYNKCRAKGVKFVKGEVKGKLTEQIEKLQEKYNVDLVINCSGLAARELAGDDKVFPLRGFVLKIKNDGVLMPKLEFAMTFNHVMLLNPEDENDYSNLRVYLIPRGDHSIWVGGGVEAHETDVTGIDMNHNLARKMLDNAKAFYPPLRAFDYEDVDEVIVGLRPARDGGARNEIDPKCPALIHNYGHAGGGVLMSWGCAVDAANLADQAVAILSRKHHYKSML